MIPYYIVLLRELESLCIGLCLLIVYGYLTKQDIRELYPESLRHPLWYYYFGVLLLVVYPYITIHLNVPHYGIWSYLYAIHPLLSVAVFTVSSGICVWYVYKKCSHG